MCRLATLLVAALLALPIAVGAQAPGSGAGAPAGDDALAQLIEGLSSRHAEQRINAASRLGQLGPRAEPAIPFLVELLDDEEQTYAGLDPNGHALTATPASCASSALVAIGSAGISALIEALQSRNANIRLTAAQTLRSVDDPRIFEVLLAAAEDRSADVRETALAALPARDDPRMLELYVAAAVDRDPGLRELAARRLGEFREPRAVDALIELLLHDDDVNTVCDAAESLADIGDARAVPALLHVLADTRLDSLARSYAASALGAFRDPSIYDGLRAAVNDAEAGVRFQALRALGSLGDRRAVPLLIDRLTTAVGNERAAAAHALGEIGAIGDARVVEALTRALEDPEPRVRAEAAEALRAIEGR